MLRRRLVAEWALVAALSCLFVVAASRQAWFGAVDNRIYDLVSGLAAPSVDNRILLVEIDDPSLRRLGRWPWPRSIHARALENLARHHPAAIAYDVLFLEHSADDDRLRQALARAGPTYLPAVIEPGTDGADHLVGPVASLAAGAGNVGIAQLLADDDGIVRRAERGLTIDGTPIPQLPTLLARRAIRDNTGQDSSEHNRAGRDDRFLIAFAGKDAFRRIPFASIANGEVPPALLAGKLVLVGATAAGMGDNHAVPASAGSLLSGIEVQANILNTLLTGTAIQTPARPAMAAVAAFPLIVLLIAFLHLSPSRNLVLAVTLAAGSLALSAGLLWGARLWLPPAATVAGLLLVHALWGWRRLAAISRFLTAQADALLHEPGMPVSGTLSGTFDGGGDSVGGGAVRLEAVIDQVRHLRQFVAGVIERFPDAVFVVDGSDHVVLCNRAAIDLVGNDAAGRPIAEIIAGIGDGAATVGTPIRLGSGRSVLMAEAAIDDGHRILSFADITELQRAADERDDLLQFLSHDLRSPNAAIVWLLESHEIENPGDQPHLPHDLRNRIRGYARHGLRLADNFVQLVRAQRRPLAREAIDLSDVAREAADMVTAHARAHGSRLRNSSDPGELWVLGDQGMLVRAAINLLENAIKFAPATATIEFAVTQQDDRVILSVRGPGPPMPAGRQADPFALYAEGRPADGKGSIGLGLAFVRTTAQRHHGDVTYLYHEGYGAEFRISLPVAQLDD
ncbi:MAG: CHASE2 domain-containing protein [Sphingomonadales bacterium]|nr:CHASE2 domain-containing protein [Sphingomonadales bacterium]